MTTTTEPSSAEFVSGSVTTNVGYSYNVTVSGLTVSPVPDDPGFSTISYTFSAEVENTTSGRSSPDDAKLYLYFAWKPSSLPFEAGETPGGEELTSAECGNSMGGVNNLPNDGEAVCIQKVFVNQVGSLTEGGSTTLTPLVNDSRGVWIVRDEDLESALEIFAAPDFVDIAIEDFSSSARSGFRPL